MEEPVLAQKLGKALIALDEDEFVPLPRGELRKWITRVLG